MTAFDTFATVTRARGCDWGMGSSMTCAGLTFSFEKFAPLGIMLVESAEQALSDLVAVGEVQPLALQLNVIVAQYVVSRVLRFVAAFLSASETVAHLVA
jgi:hypothetical protein